MVITDQLGVSSLYTRGMEPVEKDILNSDDYSHNMEPFNILLEIPSGPVAVLRCRDPRSLSTLSLVQFRDGEC